MRLVVFLIWLGVAANAVEHQTVASLSSAADVATSVGRTLDEALDDYELRLDLLKAETLARGRVTYAQVVEAAYGHDVLSRRTVARKRRLQRRSGEMPFTDYSRIHVPVHVEEKDEIPGKSPGSRLWGQYDFGRHEMFLDRTAHANVIIHEAGHVLQRKELINRRERGRSVANIADVDRVESAAKQGVISESRSARLCYLIRQDELEVRLQDLNRFFANCVSGKPILNQQDSLEALYALGIDISPEDVEAACRLGNLEEVAAVREPVSIYNERVCRIFDDASELRELCYWSKRTGTELWPDLLARIIKEAPKHY